ncbi:MAG: hypothetical protein N0E59_08965 [Candidatus Thiodiazotropha taylori]|nr:hypothetical protein [Candidatus Thiodiazotropha taylori]MCG8096086.1 hypothetical protein [Candidatus Thiodiazotropha endolucinida]MCG8106622.1 hypothetical protein [Candidatus Thiodiazotropha taylori]MCG8110882.1 hypothetical protein [Candidatus Thiodiazotropha taylori]MCW4278959.1 hypothetical protein [Candidatus Thiodiazotropha taylori]
MSTEFMFGLIFFLGSWAFNIIYRQMQNPQYTTRVVACVQSEELDDYDFPLIRHEFRKDIKISMRPIHGMKIETSGIANYLTVSDIIAFDGGLAVICEPLAFPQESLPEEVEYLTNAGWNEVP